MSLVHVDFNKSKTQKPMNFGVQDKKNSFSNYGNDRASSPGLSPVYSNQRNSIINENKIAAKQSLFSIIITWIKAIFELLYLLITDFSFTRLFNTLSSIIDLFLRPIKSMLRNKKLMVLLIFICLIMCMGYVFTEDSQEKK